MITPLKARGKDHHQMPAHAQGQTTLGHPASGHALFVNESAHSFLRQPAQMSARQRRIVFWIDPLEHQDHSPIGTRGNPGFTDGLQQIAAGATTGGGQDHQSLLILVLIESLSQGTQVSLHGLQ